MVFPGNSQERGEVRARHITGNRLNTNSIAAQCHPEARAGGPKANRRRYQIANDEQQEQTQVGKKAGVPRTPDQSANPGPDPTP